MADFDTRKATYESNKQTPSYDVEYNYLNNARRSARSKYLWETQKEYDKAKKIQDIDIEQNKKNYENNLYDIDQYLHYADESYIDNLAKTDKNLAEALQQATEWYSAGWLFWSWVANQRTRKMLAEWEQVKDTLWTQKEQTEDKYITARERAIDKYHTNIKPKEDIAKQDLQDKFSKAKSRAPWLINRDDFMTSPETFRK